jgi:membrane protein
MRTEKYLQRIVDFYDRLNRKTAGWLAVLIRAATRLMRKRTTLAAAGITYFSIFSLFPLLIVTISILTSFLDEFAVWEAIRLWLDTALPVPMGQLMDDVEGVLAGQGSITLFAIGGFLFAASGMFYSILLNVNFAWGIETIRSRMKSRILALLFAVAIAAVVVLLLILLSVVRLVFSIIFKFLGNPLVNLMPQIGLTLIFYGIYKYGPATRVDSRAAIISALAASLASEASTGILTWFINSEWENYQLLFGSLSAIIGFLFWIYILNLIILAGAYLAEAIQDRWKSADPSQYHVPLIFPYEF